LASTERPLMVTLTVVFGAAVSVIVVS